MISPFNEIGMHREELDFGYYIIIYNELEIMDIADELRDSLIALFGIRETALYVPCRLIRLYDKTDEEIGFVAYNFFDSVTIYIQYAAYTCSYRKKIHRPFKELMSYFLANGLTIFASIHNSNYEAIMMALKHGFSIIGSRVQTKDNVMVEVLLEPNEQDSTQVTRNY
jgi:hypothetical protein